MALDRSIKKPPLYTFRFRVITFLSILISLACFFFILQIASVFWLLTWSLSDFELISSYHSKSFEGCFFRSECKILLKELKIKLPDNKKINISSAELTSSSALESKGSFSLNINAGDRIEFISSQKNGRLITFEPHKEISLNIAITDKNLQITTDDISLVKVIFKDQDIGTIDTGKLYLLALSKSKIKKIKRNIEIDLDIEKNIFQNDGQDKIPPKGQDSLAKLDLNRLLTNKIGHKEEFISDSLNNLLKLDLSIKLRTIDYYEDNNLDQNILDINKIGMPIKINLFSKIYDKSVRTFTSIFSDQFGLEYKINSSPDNIFGIIELSNWKGMIDRITNLIIQLNNQKSNIPLEDFLILYKDIYNRIIPRLLLAEKSIFKNKIYSDNNLTIRVESNKDVIRLNNIDVPELLNIV